MQAKPLRFLVALGIGLVVTMAAALEATKAIPGPAVVAPLWDMKVLGGAPQTYAATVPVAISFRPASVAPT
jgi:hypothetical protein